MQHNLLDKLQSANNTLDKMTALRLYNEVRKETQGNKASLLLYAQATRELVYLTTSETKRATLWRDVYNKLLKVSSDPDPDYLEQAAITLKEMIHDRFNGLQLSFLSKELKKLFGLLSDRISQSDNSLEIKSQLLARERNRGQAFSLGIWIFALSIMGSNFCQFVM